MTEAQGGPWATIRVSEEIMMTLAVLAKARRTDIPGVLAEAISLEEKLVEARDSGSRLGVLTGSRFAEITTDLDRQHDQASGNLLSQSARELLRSRWEKPDRG